MEVKLCKDCKHLVVRKDQMTKFPIPRCTRNVIVVRGVDPVFGGEETTVCGSSLDPRKDRKEDGECGLNGKYWEAL